MASPDDTTHEPNEAIERLLRAAAPGPDARWAADLERQLLPARSSRTQRWRFALGTSVGLAVAIVAVTLAGAGPLASGGGDDAKAKPGCETVFVTEIRPTGQLRRDADGTVRVETVRQPVVREVERCR
ncbi:MAG: hypothetical protein J7513_00405 [Solirubrobacteraceae bacterium]|nr:hypothetical protein [Solirubrobacteraceae bacterium]